jgi:UDP-N-acetylglucosamine--N-acetylmuramyl-(pentapeptide) pyrophosphoryl-undecaprenol N-acetylglucosamine transferase
MGDGGEGDKGVERKALGPFRMVIAGGGTGGHLFPGLAVARELEKRLPAEILFVVGRRRMESEILSRYGYPVASIDVEGLKGRGWKRGLAVFFKLPKGFFQSICVLREFKPRLVLGVGGYSSGPFCLASRCLGTPTAVHEQNSFPGLTNRLLSRFVDRVFISFEESREHFTGGSLVFTGNPVREELFSKATRSVNGGRAFTILVLGGSQGARAVNEAFVEAVTVLNKQGKYPDLIHQAGEADYDRLKRDYAEKGIPGEVVPFIQDMATAYARADLVVSRAGATTLSELAALGKPSILIPYPHAANQHQETNALALERAGGSEIIRQKELAGKGLARAITRLMDDRTALEEMGRRAKEQGRPEAAKAIVDQLLAMGRGGSTSLHQGKGVSPESL